MSRSKRNGAPGRARPPSSDPAEPAPPGAAAGAAPTKPPGSDPSTGELSSELERALGAAVEALARRRRLGIFGYLGALVLMIGGGVLGLAWMGQAPPGEFRGWILLLPLGAGGLWLWVLGAWGRRARKRT
jgi:hypothetical protein